jgi:hypothetical protein
MPVLFPTFLFPDAELGDSIGRTLQKILTRLGAVKAPVSGTALASGARTVSTSSAVINTVGFRGVIFYWNVTAASGVGGLTGRVFAQDPVLGTLTHFGSMSAATTTTGARGMMVGPGVGSITAAASGSVAFIGANLPRDLVFNVQAADASSYTYSVTYELIP